jgi:BlaI family penicillinase repressor
MSNMPEIHLSRRERQIMDVIYARGQASAAEVHRGIPDRPSYSAIRALLRILETKGHLRHRMRGKMYIYTPTRSRADASRTAARRLLRTFFNGSAEKAVAALLEASDIRLKPGDFERLARLIEKVRKEGR